MKTLIKILLVEMYILETISKDISWQTFTIARPEALEGFSDQKRLNYKLAWKWLLKNSNKQDRRMAYEGATSQKRILV